MRFILIASPFALLAACNSGSDAPPAADNAANAAAPEAAANASMSAANTAAAVDPRRAGELQECADDVRTELPAGTDISAFCNCSVDGMATGASERDAMNACAAQMGIPVE